MLILNSILSGILTALIIIFLVIIILALVFIRFKSKNKTSTFTNVKQKKAKTIILSNIDVEYDTIDNPFEKKHNFILFKQKLNSILLDDKIEKIILDVNKIHLSDVQCEELKDIFKKLNEKKEVISIAMFLTNNNYNIAMLANKIYLEDTVNSTVILQGYYRKYNYLKNFFNKIGIHINVLHIGDYKSYGEQYSKDRMSKELKETITRLNDKKFDLFIKDVKDKRNYDIKKDVINAKYIFNEDNNIVDSRVNKENFLDNEEKLIDFNDYKPKKIKNKSKNIIAIISLEGTISENEISLEKVKEKLDPIIGEEKYKALVIQINSPGGSAYESSKIYNYIKNNVEIPIYISMKDVCASGGYFIASTGNKLYANKNTLTGSIGVVSIYPTTTKLLKKLGINYDGIQFGKSTEYGNINEYLRNDTKELVISHLENVYREFKSVVMKARNMSDEVLEPIAQGKVWLGEEAKEIGLVDDIKNIDEIIYTISKDLNFKNYKLELLNNKFEMNKYIKNKVPFMNMQKLIYQPLLLCEALFI